MISPRSLIEIGDTRYNVRAFGAKGDGVEDDSDALDAALSASIRDGAILCLPPGRYRHTRPLVLPAYAPVRPWGYAGNSLVIEGAGLDNTWLEDDVADGPGIDFMRPSGVSSFVLRVAGLSLSNLRNKSEDALCRLTKLTKAVEFHRVAIRTFNRTARAGILLNDCWQVELRGCQIDCAGSLSGVEVINDYVNGGEITFPSTYFSGITGCGLQVRGAQTAQRISLPHTKFTGNFRGFCRMRLSSPGVTFWAGSSAIDLQRAHEKLIDRSSPRALFIGNSYASEVVFVSDMTGTVANLCSPLRFDYSEHTYVDLIGGAPIGLATHRLTSQLHIQTGHFEGAGLILNGVRCATVESSTFGEFEDDDPPILDGDSVDQFPVYALGKPCANVTFRSNVYKTLTRNNGACIKVIQSSTDIPGPFEGRQNWEIGGGTRDGNVFDTTTCNCVILI